MEWLRRGLRNESGVELDQAALDIASIEDPDLDRAHYLGLLDDYARIIARRLQPAAAGPDYVREINRFLFEDLELKGDQADYYNPKNSCLNQVLDRRLGIPITVSLVYMEVARRLGKRVYGIGQPGHFVVEYRDEEYSIFLDPFHGGRQIEIEPTFVPASHAQILARMLNNLQAAYFRAGEFAKAVRALDLLIEARPNAADFYKSRGIASLQLRKLRAANADFQTYLNRNPDASDRLEITKQMEQIQRWLGVVN